MVQLVFTIWKFILVVILTNSQNIQETKSLEFLVSLRDKMESKNKNQQLEFTMISDNSYDIFTSFTSHTAWFPVKSVKDCGDLQRD